MTKQNKLNFSVLLLLFLALPTTPQECTPPCKTCEPNSPTVCNSCIPAKEGQRKVYLWGKKCIECDENCKSDDKCEDLKGCIECKKDYKSHQLSDKTKGLICVEDGSLSFFVRYFTPLFIFGVIFLIILFSLWMFLKGEREE